MNAPAQVTYERWWVVYETENSYSGPQKCKAEHATTKAVASDVSKRLARDCPPKQVTIYRSDREAGCANEC